MAVREAEVGIRSFTDNLDGFTAVLKHTWRDFHVNEIGLDGKVAQLTSLNAPVESTVAVGALLPDDEEDDPLSATIRRFVSIVGHEDAEKLRLLVSGSESEKTEFIEVGPINDKERRTEVHRFFKEVLPGFPPLVTEAAKKNETNDTYIRIALLSRAKKMRGWRNRSREGSRNKNADGETCRYVHFVLYKENTDNQMAINVLSKELSVPPTVFRLAGTKDKRGITTQWVAAQNVDVHRLAALNARLKFMKVGNFTPTKENLYVGDLIGNQFRIALRDVRDTTHEKIAEACESLKRRGFVNYFGLQRFGRAVPTHLVGAALLKGDWKSAANLILKPTPDDDRPTAEAKQCFLAGNIDGALERLPNKALSERALLQGYSELGPEQHLSSLNRIGRNTRTLYVHAYQSYLWNHVVSERIRRFGPNKVLEGDLVMIDDSHNAAERRKTSGSRLASVTCVTADQIASNRYSIDDVVLPLPGASVVYPKNEMEAVYHEIAEQDGVSLRTSAHKVKEFNIEKLSGDYRKLIVKVEDLEYDIIDYRDSYEPLLKSDWEQLQEAEAKSPQDATGEGLTPQKRPAEESEIERKRPRLDHAEERSSERLALTLKFTLPSSSYATMLVRQLTKFSTSVADQVSISTNDISINETKAQNSSA